MDIFSLIILFAVGSFIVRIFKKIGQTAKQAQTQAEIEATKQRPVQMQPPIPAPKPADFRFPPVQKPAPKPVYQEGRDPDMGVYNDLSNYTPIAPSADLKNQFSDYQGSISTPSTEGTGYQTEAYDEVAVPYRTNQNTKVKILPEAFTRDALLQAVVMAEVLKRPGARR